MENDHIRKPSWLKTKLPGGEGFRKTREIVEKNGLHTICLSGTCPNMAECWGKGTATLMILGDICTRSCRFCNVTTGKPKPPDEEEPGRVARTVNMMKVKHCVITSVDRDDLPDGGSGIWAATIRKIREVNPGVTIEALIPDFNGRTEDIARVIDSKPEIISHNLETVRRLTPLVRTKAKYDLSLAVLTQVSQSGVRAKTGLMVGLGEKEEEVIGTMHDALDAGCSIFTLGQYLRPGPANIAVSAYIHPDVFERYRLEGLRMGFSYVESGPLVRSSYHAEMQL